MLSITDGGTLARVLDTPLDARLKHLLLRRHDQLGGDITGQAHFLIVQPDDPLPTIKKALGFDPFCNPADGSRYGDPDFTPGWEWIEDHGFAFETVFIFEDSGFAHVLIVEKAEGMHPDVIGLCETFAPAGQPSA